MPIDILSGKITTKTRDEVRDDYLRSYRLRNPSADTGVGSLPYIDASAFADQCMVPLADAVSIGNMCTSENKTGTELDDEAARRGLTRQGAAGASGYVEITAGPAGTTIFAEDTLTNEGGTTYEVISTALYLDGDHVPIVGVDTGPTTNQDAGTVLQWSAPRPGCGPTAVVVAQSDGSGLSGGRNIETDAELQERIRDWNANQPASGNAAAYQAACLEVPGVTVQQAFVYPATLGPGTIGIALTMPPAYPGASRLPNAAQLAQVLANITGRFPEDDGVFMMLTLAENWDLCLGVDWTDDAAAWANISPWPSYHSLAAAAGSGAVIVQAATDPTHFILETNDADYSTCGDPAVGTVIGFYDPTYRVFRRKQISSVTGGGPWTIVCTTANAASDSTYTPVVGQRCCPWSDSLDLLVPPILSYFGTLGPGEQQLIFTDEGARQRRYPLSPRYWPHEISGARILRDILDSDAVQDAEVLEGDDSTMVGVPGTLVYLMQVRYLAAFAM